MPVLAFDTSAAVAVSLTDDDGTLLAQRSDEQQRHHAELLTPMIAAVLADAAVDRRELTSVVVGTGPAPFTGLRVGLVTARTLALALGIPARGVPSLDAIAAAASRRLPAGTDVVVATDARRREVYWSLYRLAGPGRIEVLVPPSVGAAAAVPVNGAVVVGRGAELYRETFEGPARDLAAGPVVAPVGVVAIMPDLLDGLRDPDPAELARLSLQRRDEILDTEPLYLRRPDAVPPAERKRALG